MTRRLMATLCCAAGLSSLVAAGCDYRSSMADDARAVNPTEANSETSTEVASIEKETSRESSSPEPPARSQSSGTDSPGTDVTSKEPAGKESSAKGSSRTAPAAAKASDKPTQPEASKPARTKQKPRPTTASPDELSEISFDTIKFDMDKEERFERSMLTEQIEALVGRRVRIRGYIFPTSQQTGLTEFVLVRDNMECCFGPGAALYDCVFVEMNEGKSTDFSVRPVAVEGTFTVNELIGPDGKHLAIYHLAGEKVSQ